MAAVCDRLVAEASSAPGGERLISVVPPSRGPRRCGFSTIALATSQSRVFPRDDLGSGSAEGFRSTEGTTNGYRTGCPRVVVSSAGKATLIKVRGLPPASPLSTSTSPSGSFATRTIGPVPAKPRDPFAECVGCDRLALAATLWGKQEGRWFRRRTHQKFAPAGE